MPQTDLGRHGFTKLESLAIRMAMARRKRIDSSRILNGPYPIGGPVRGESKIEQARADLSAARIEWRKASAALWRLVAKMEAGEA